MKGLCLSFFTPFEIESYSWPLGSEPHTVQGGDNQGKWLNRSSPLINDGAGLGTATTTTTTTPPTTSNSLHIP